MEETTTAQEETQDNDSSRVAVAVIAATSPAVIVDTYGATSKSSSSPPNIKKQATVAGTTKTPPTTAKTRVDQITVKELGQKTRSRFVHERSKRPEIKRLDTAPPPVQDHHLRQPAAGAGATLMTRKDNPQQTPRKRKSATTSKSNSRSSSSSSKKKRGSAASQQQQHPDDDDEKIVDYWFPDISKLALAQQRSSSPTFKKEEKSNCVLLHGLPINTTSAHIQSFFRGLNPVIKLLPSLNQFIPTWDAGVNAAASSSPPLKKKRQGKERNEPVIERYPFYFRVLVKFQSAPTAALAVDRSGELLTMTTTIHNTNTNDDNNNNEVVAEGGGAVNKIVTTTTSAAIGVTPVPKSDASYLLRYLAIDADESSSSTSKSLETTLSRIEQVLGQDVLFILWMAAKHHLQLNSVDLSSFMSTASSTTSTSTTITTDTSCLLFLNDKNHLHRIKSRPILAKQRNQLLELYKRLLRHDDDEDLSCCLLDPELVALDPILRLTLNAANHVMEQVKRIDDRLLILTRLQQKQLSPLPLFSSSQKY